MSAEFLLDKVWTEVLATVKDNVEPESYDTWLLPIRPISLENDVLLIEVPSHFFYEYIEDYYADILSKSLKKITKKSITLEYKILLDKQRDKSVRYSTSASSNHQTSEEYPLLPQRQSFDAKMNPFTIPGIRVGQIHPQLNPNYTFDNFIEGSCNRIARNAGLQIVEKFSKHPFNPFLIHSDSGLGKTHLINAIGNAAKQKYPALNVLYVSSEKFINQFISYSKNNQITEFVNFYQQIDLLMVDDVHVFARAEKTQEAFFAIFNHLHQTGKQIILTLDRPPQDLEGLQDRLLSRFRWGLTAELELPDYETRVLILKNKMKRDGVYFNGAIVDYIATHVKNSIRELEGIIISLLAQSSFDKREVDLDMVFSIIKSRVKTHSVSHSMDDIQKIVSLEYSITVDDIKGKVRKREFVEARHLSMYLIKKYIQSSLKTIGKNFGDRDHTTIIHACHSVENLLSTDRRFKDKVESIKQKLNLLD